MNVLQAQSAIEDVLAQLEVDSGQRVTALGIYEHDVTPFTSAGKVCARGVVVEMQTYSIEYMPFPRNTA